jgi:integrase/recombinase XerD
MVKMRINKNNQMSIKKAKDKFIRHCKIKDLSESTTIYYNNCYDYFINFLKSELNCDDNLLINDIDKTLIENFILWLKNTYNMNNITINTRIRGIRAFLYYFMRQNIIQKFKIDLLKADKKIKKTYNDEELKRLLNKPDMDNSSFSEYRNWVIINFLLATAVRSKSLRNIKVEDVDLEEGVVFINTIKNRKQQVLLLYWKNIWITEMENMMNIYFVLYMVGK